MYSKEFMKFLYGYQKEDFSKKSEKTEISFKDKGRGKPVKVYVTVPNK
jgi:hypothetical protein